jgi:hypothetical protein
MALRKFTSWLVLCAVETPPIQRKKGVKQREPKKNKRRKSKDGVGIERKRSKGEEMIT